MNENQNDHDLLIQIATKLDRAISDIKELKDNAAARIDALEQEKLNQKEFEGVRAAADKLHNDHEKRLRRIEKWGFLAIGALGFLQIVANLYTNYFHK
jgi:phage-related minor tail protein